VSAGATSTSRGPGAGGIVGSGVLLAGVVAALIVAFTRAPAVLGVPDPGPLTNLGLPAMRAVAQAAGVLTVGAALFAAFLAAPQDDGRLGVGGYAALRTVTWFGALWTVAAALLVPLTVADSLGRPLSEVLTVDVLTKAVPTLSSAEAWLLTAGIAAVVTIGSRAVLTWGWTVPLCASAVGGLLPVALTGHSSSGGSHDVATNSLLLHVLAASLWVGGLAALVLHGRRLGEHLGTAARRFSALALVCWLVMAGSGVVNALVRVPLSEVLSTTYGLLVVAKVGALVALGGIGYEQRQKSVTAVVDRGDGRSLTRLGTVEVLLMLATVGLAVALGRTPPPDGARRELSPSELLLGYDLTGPPTVLRLLFDWRFDLVYGTAAVVAAGLYLYGVRRLRRRGDAWPMGRTAAWLAGCLVVLLATSSGIGRYAPAMFSVHMGSHMMLSMLAPALLVLGGAVTLALRVLPTAGDGPPGAREWLLAGVHSPVARALTHPIVALVLFSGSFFFLYFSGLFDAALTRHWAHLAMNAHFLLVGVLFYWPVIGVDPTPRRLQPLGRLGLVFASLPFHAFFGVILMGSATVIGESFYTALGLPWVTDLLEDQRLGGGLAWASGEIPLLVVLVALLVQWARADERAARRSDRRADADGDADREAYNAMLRRMADREP
jgi:cytochrome c oxidase assembly factor CtaG/putative copper export protein